MPVTRLTSQTMPQSGLALQELLRTALECSSPLEDFIQIIRDMTQYEMRHQMDSQEFFTRFQSGALGDEMDYMRWANKYEIYLEMKSNLQQMFDVLLNLIKS